MKILSENRSHGGVQYVASHRSAVCNCDMTFAMFLPPQAETNAVPVLWYLSGLTCTHANVMEKGEYRRAAAENGIAIVCPDTSPRGADVADEDVYYFGSGAGYYVDATKAPYAEHYRMYSYVSKELPALVLAEFNLDRDRQSIFGHSMGGHGALSIALKNPTTYRSVSALAPICAPLGTEWVKMLLANILAPTNPNGRAYDSVALIEDEHRVPEILVDQGSADEFLDTGLQPHLLRDACAAASIPLDLRVREGYDHSYYFISTFMADHIAWHAERLK